MDERNVTTPTELNAPKPRGIDRRGFRGETNERNQTMTSPDKTTALEFLVWWANNWKDADKVAVAEAMERLTTDDREKLTLLVARASTWVR